MGGGPFPIYLGLKQDCCARSADSSVYKGSGIFRWVVSTNLESMGPIYVLALAP